MTIEKILISEHGKYQSFEIYRAKDSKPVTMSYHSELLWDSSIGYEPGICKYYISKLLKLEAGYWEVLNNAEYNSLLNMGCGDIDFSEQSKKVLVIIVKDL